MLTIGITGSSGSGKGYVCSKLALLGYPCLDTDAVSRIVYKKGQACHAELEKYFGNEILTNDGEIDRGRLFTVAFTSPEKYEYLTKTAYRHILKYTKEWIEDKRAEGHALSFVDAPMLFESGFNGICDYTLAVICDRATQLRRVTERDSISKEKALARISKQKTNKFFIENCDFIIDNSDKNAENVKGEINAIAEQLKSIAGK